MFFEDIGDNEVFGLLMNKLKRNLNIKGVIKFILLPYNGISTLIKRKHIVSKCKELERHYDRVINDINSRGDCGLSFGAYVIYDSSFGADGLVQLMLENKNYWRPQIVIIPDVSRGLKHMKNSYEKTKDFFVKKYGVENVIDGYDWDSNTFRDVSSLFDVIYCANPYDSMVDRVHSIEYLSSQNCLPFYISYGYDVGKITTKQRLRGGELNYVWKCFTDTLYSQKDFKKYQVIKGKNTSLVGYAKMDKYYAMDKKKKSKKKILIASHHTVLSEELPLSNFLEYSQLVLELAENNRDIDFVFRPHPLLFTKLVDRNIWTEEEVEEYLSSLERNGVECSQGGDYFELFAECDAIINDCGSFTVEWLYTGKPGCFVYNKKLCPDILTELMNKAIETYTVARKEEDIINFVNDVKYNRVKTHKIDKWVMDNIFVKYPYVSKCILDEIDLLKEKR